MWVRKLSRVLLFLLAAAPIILMLVFMWLLAGRAAEPFPWSQVGGGEMMKPMELPGLERLLDVCERLELGLETSPPAREPMTAGSLVEGVPLDPVLASVYARLGHAAFATKVMRWGLDRCEDRENRLKENNKGWRELYWNDLGRPVIVFGGGIYAYATVPDLADARAGNPWWR